MKLMMKMANLSFSVFSLTLLFVISTGFTDKKSSASLKPDLYTLSRIDSAKTRDDLIKWSAKDSTKFSKNKTLIFLYGHAKLTCKEFDITADEISFDQKAKKVVAKNYKMISAASNKVAEGKYGEFYIH
ncbi:hypothetical protein EV200_102369 [Pedobacter psychrotolerans]|uniref:Uncharacterized protein n=2 Tax=Pedobacter psychrotolerans TaxID=1843235 RepID=A0A4R2HI63_9SPHI|nr:hypothetical protein EV200_102369 [Pedobacter psychrotolerans]GGE53056.1 hypothetical protein GCM10011413_19200 [Pedobacter psychrotolerans]